MDRRTHGVFGSALIDVLLSLTIVATLAVTTSQIQFKQRRLQELLTQRLKASALLDAWAERRQMGVSARVNNIQGVPERAMVAANAAAAAGAGAAAGLPNGRAYEYPRGDAFVELEIRWRPPSISLPLMAQSENGVVRGARHSDQGADGSDEQMGESILVAAMQ